MKNVFLKILGLSCMILINCSGSNDQQDKAYINLRHTKNTALFTCKAPTGVEATFRSNRDDSGTWSILNFRNKDIKQLAQEFCEARF